MLILSKRKKSVWEDPGYVSVLLFSWPPELLSGEAPAPRPLSHSWLGFGKPWGQPFAALSRANPVAHPSSLCLWCWRWYLEGTWLGTVRAGEKHRAVLAAVVCALGLPLSGSTASGVPGHGCPPWPSTAWYSWQHWGYFSDPVLPASSVADWELRCVLTIAVRPLDHAEPLASSQQWTPCPCFGTVNFFAFSFTKSSLGH